MSIFLVGTLAILCGLVLAGGAVSVLALFQARAVIQTAAAGAKTIQGQRDGEIESLRVGLSGLAAQFRDLQQQNTPMQATPAMPKQGLNLNKRSQALRMHRRGEVAGADRGRTRNAAPGSPASPESAVDRPRQRLTRWR